jgi:hypothetical protein
MAQSNVILLTVNYAGSQFLNGQQRAFNIDNIASPIKLVNGLAVVPYKESRAKSYNQVETGDVVNHIVTESLSAIAAAAEGVVLLNVKARGINAGVCQRFSTAVQMVFISQRFAGSIDPLGTGASFTYHEFGATGPVYYEVEETPAAIVGSLPVGGDISGTLTPTRIPYASGIHTLSDSPMFRVVDGSNVNVAIDRGSSFRSDVAGEAEWWFSASGDGWTISTDGVTYAESFIEVIPNQLGMYHAGGADKVELTNTALFLFHTAEIAIQSPLTTFAGDVHIQNGDNIDSALVGGTVGLFNTNASLVNFGVNGGNISVASTLSMLGAKVQLTAGTTTVPSMNIATGVAPTTPSDGDIWFDGTDIKIRVGGVTKTFTLV